ncbi:hypothetical protein PR202_gb17105 [Eleusine coracana subsp. coracana]|uniref:Peptidase A1 domain-containing protein n=1 Tax=Eleusine coracana subsp. coracana TaxID=191504 RepID=A0AAV5F381_ELECO|nr:hypothetical protein PR202_gb17105 [Eleusine coracana subsp. coracana]
MASPVLLFILLCSYYSTAHGGDKHGFVVVPTSSFEPEALCSTARVTRKEQNGATVLAPLVHRHGPCVPSSQSSTNKPSLAETLRRSRARADYIVSRASSRGSSNVSVPTYLGTSVDSLEYGVTLGIGTPAVSQFVLIDTGSDLSWVQCQPCNSTKCYKQKDPLFDPRKSTTYAPIPCHTDVCRRLTVDRYGAGCTDGGAHCGYFIQYGDGSRTNGVYSHETLTLGPGVAVTNFRFGCGYDQRQTTDKFDGILGLGGAPESLPVQTASIYGGAFSYCLPPVKSKPGFLALGGPKPSNTAAHGPGFVFTPMGRAMGRVDDELTSYVVRLTGISVGGIPLDVPASAFRGGMIIDSGQIVTRLQTTQYNALQAAFRKAMAAYPRLHNGDLDTCYNFTGYGNVTVPRIALTFAGGATVDLDVPHGVLLNNCLAFEESGPDIGLGMIGNVNTRTLEVLYDVGRSQLGFRSGAC